MATKVKVSRLFTFKAYECGKDQEVFNNAHSGEFKLKSECHYYCEKGLLDFIKTNVKSCEGKKYLIYKVSTQEDSKIEDMLIEQIFVKDDVINII